MVLCSTSSFPFRNDKNIIISHTINPRLKMIGSSRANLNNEVINVEFLNGKQVVYTVKETGPPNLRKLVTTEVQYPVHNEEQDEASKMAVETVEESHR